MKRTWLLGAALAVVIVPAVVGWTIWAGGQTTSAPEFGVTTTGLAAAEEGPTPLNLTSFRGRTLVLDFMGVTCTACRVVEHETLVPLWREFGNRSDFALLSIDAWAGSAGETEAELSKFQREAGHPWPYAMDTDGVLAKYGGYAIPKIVVITPEGTVAYDETGAIDRQAVHRAVEASLAGHPPTASLMAASLPALSLVAGAATFVSPCSVGLVPAYLARVGAVGRSGIWRIAKLAGGTVLAYAVLALLLWAAGAWLRPYIPTMSLAVGAAMMVGGLILMTRLEWDRVLPAKLRQTSERAGPIGFGFAYGLAAFGCSGPVFLPLLATAFLAGPWTGWLSLAAYWLAFAGLFAAAALGVQAGGGKWLGLARHARTIQLASGALMVAGGAYLVWYYDRAYGVF